MIVTEFELETKESIQPDRQTSHQAGTGTVWQLGNPTVGKPDNWIVWRTEQPVSLTDETGGHSDRRNRTAGQSDRRDPCTVWLDCACLTDRQLDCQKAWHLVCLADRQPDGRAVVQLTCRPRCGRFSFWFVRVCNVWYPRLRYCYFKVNVDIIYEMERDVSPMYVLL